MTKVFFSLFLLLSFNAWADRGPKFGSEFTFAQPDGKSGKSFKQFYLTQLFQHLVQDQPDEFKYDHNSSARRGSLPDQYYSPFKWWFRVGTDPGVIETDMMPMTVDEFLFVKDSVQDSIFVSAAIVNLVPQPFLGGGHISIDYNYFVDKPLLLRNFIMDLYNHNELFTGIFNFDSRNALPMNLLHEKARNQILEVFSSFDKALMNQTADIEQLMIDISNIGRSVESKDDYREHWGLPDRTREHAVNLANARDRKGEQARIELRGFRPQASADVFYRQIRLLNKRIQFLKNITEPIAFKEEIQFLDTEITKYNYDHPPVNAQESLSAFHKYVTEAGEDWAEHQDYIWPDWIAKGELKKFNSSLSCETLLTEH